MNFSWFLPQFSYKGRPVSGGTLSFFVAGSTTIPKNVWYDAALTIVAPHVIELDSYGTCPEIYPESGQYLIELRDQFGALLYTRDHVEGSGTGGSAYDDHKVSNDSQDIPGYLKQKLRDSDTVKWSEIVEDGFGMMKADVIDLDKVPAVVVWNIMSPSDPTSAPFGLSNEDVNAMIETGFGVASQMEQSTFPSNLSIWYATGTYWGDAVWEEKKFPLGTCITNLNKQNYDYLHVHPEDHPITNPSNYPAGIYTAVMVGDGLYWESLLVQQYPDPSFNITSFLQYDATNKAFVWIDADSVGGKVKVSATDGTAEYLAEKIFSDHPEYITVEDLDIGDPAHTHKIILRVKGANPLGPAGGDLFGSYPNPRVKELTGVPVMLTDSVATFDWKYSGVWASGAGIGYGTGYVDGVEKPVWMAVSQQGELQISYDEWKTTVYVDPSNAHYSTFTFTPQGETEPKTQAFNNLRTNAPFTNWRYASVACMVLPGSTSKWWVFSAEGKLAMAEVKPENFNANGSLKIEAIEEWSFTGIDPNTVTSNGTVMIWTGNSTQITYAEAGDIYYDSKYIAGHNVTPTPPSGYSVGVIGGNAWNGTEFMAIGRDSGIIYTSPDGANWTISDVESVKYQDGTTMEHHSANEYAGALPTNTNPGSNPAWGTNGNAWCGMLYANDMWIVVNGKPAPSTINTAWSPFMFSYDKSNWNGYMPTADELAVNYSYSMYKIAYGHGKTFATNSDPFQDYKDQPPIYRLLMDEIPAHRKLVAEKGMDVIGTLALLDLPNAEALGTDEDGNVVAVPGTAASIGDAPKTDYVFSPFPWASRKWIPNGKASGPVEAVMGNLVIDEVAHTITVPAYTVQLFDNINFLGQPLRYNVAQTTFTLTTPNVRQFVVAKYISPGVAQTILTPFIEDVDMSQAFPLFSVERVVYSDGTSKIHSIGFDTLGEGLAQKIEIAHLRVEPYRRSKEGGLDISSTSLNLSLTASLVFSGTTPQNILAYSSASGDALVHAYKVAGVWTYTAETGHTFNNTQYQGTTDLVTLGNNKYKCVWFFRSIGDDKEVYYVDGTAEYNTASDAQAEKVPTIPSLVNWHCLLVGRVIIQKSATSGYIVQSAFDNSFVASSAGGAYIRNQASDGTNDAPGNIFADPYAVWKIRYEDTSNSANNVDWVSFSKDMLKIQGLDVNNPALIGYQAELTPSALALRGRPGTSYGIYNAAAIISREAFNWVPNVNGAWYEFNFQDLGGGTAMAQGGYRFPRLKFRISDTDTVSAEMVHKIVDSNGAELSQVTNGTYGKALQIPTTLIAGTPNAQELWPFASAEGDPHTIAQDGSDSGNCSGNRGFAFIATSSRTITKMKMFFTQSAGNYRMGLYDSGGKLLAKTANIPVAVGTVWVNLLTPVTLVGGNVYYMAYYLSDTTGNVKFYCISGRSTYNAGQLLQIYDINNEMPANLGTSGSKTQFRPWILISE